MSDSSRRPSDLPSALLAGSVAALLYILRYGYRFGTGDHDELLPPILARIDHGLYSNDAFVLHQLDGVTVRTTYQIVVGLFARLFGLPLAVDFLHIAVLVAVGAGLFSLARAWGAGRLASSFGVLVAVVAVPTLTLGGNALVYTLLTPEGMAWAFVVWGLVAFARGMIWATATLLGVAAWFHALAGGLVLGVFIILLVWRHVRDEKRTWRQVIGASFLGVFIALALVAPALIRQSAESGAVLPDGLDPFTLYARLRFPHHYLPQAFGPQAWVRFGFLVAAGIAGFHFSRFRERPVRESFALRFVIVCGVLAVMGLVGVVAFESLSVARAQVFKLSVPVNAMMSLSIGIAIASLVPRPTRKKLESIMRDRRWALGITVLVLAGASARILSTQKNGPGVDIAAWARTETARSATFIVPPSLDGFRVPARRGVVVTWKAVPFRTDLAADWWTRLTDIAPLDAPPSDETDLAASFARGYTQMSDADRQRLGETYRADYAVLSLGTETALPVEVEGKNWKVVRLSR